MNAPIKTAAKNVLSENITKLLKAHDTNESDLARQLNLTYNTIHRLVSGTTFDPKLSTLQQIAEYFNVSLDFLLTSSNPCSSTTDTPRTVPVITWDKLPITTIDTSTISKWLPIATDEKKLINENCYALESTRSMQPKFPIGTTFVIKPDELPRDGDLVVVKFREDNSISLRELIVDSPDWQLQSIIPGSKNLIFDKVNFAIIGVVILTVIQTRHFF